MKSAFLRTSDRILERLGSFSAVILLVALYAFVVRTRINLGYWPSYGNPDPKSLILMEKHYTFIWMWSYCIFWISLSVLIHWMVKKTSFFMIKLLPLLVSGMLFFMYFELNTVIICSWWASIIVSVGLIVALYDLKHKRDIFDCFFVSTNCLLWLHNILDPFGAVSWIFD